MILVGNGRCDFLGYSVKYGIYIMLDVKSNKIVDFKVVLVCEVKNLNVMEEKGFIGIFNIIEEVGVDVVGVLIDFYF